jgi:hypothetical protein
MAGIAGQSSGVVGGDDLWKILRLGGVSFVTADAKHGRVGKLGNHGAWVFRMVGQWSVTGFTSDIRVLAFALGLDLIRMASFTRLTAGELDGPRTDVVHRRCPKMAVLPKVGRDDGASDNKECYGAERQQQYYPDQVFRAAQKTLHVQVRQQFSDPMLGRAI